MQQILLEVQRCFPKFIGNSLGRPASSDSMFLQFHMPSTVATPVESPDDTASLQNSTDAARLVLLFDQFYIQGVPGGMCETSGECFLC